MKGTLVMLGAGLLVVVAACTAIRHSTRRDVLLNMADSSVLVIEEKETGSGSGTVIRMADGFTVVLTCYHVVDDMNLDNIRLQDRQGARVKAVLDYFDAEADLALLVTAGPLNVRPIVLAAQSPPLYSTLYLGGAPNGELGTSSEAVLTSKHRAMQGFVNDRWRVIGGYVFPGISGGTATNEAGELVGVPEAVSMVGGMPLPQAAFVISWEEVVKFIRASNITPSLIAAR